MSSEIKADRVIDTKDMQCPRPLLTAKQALEVMQPGEILEVIANDRTTQSTFPAYTKKNGHELMGISDDGRVLRIFVRKGTAEAQ